MNLRLSGCAPEPLIHYLKALGVFRVLARQKDPVARARWAGNTFWLETALTEKELIDFLIHQYEPSPLVSPWNGGGGFYGKTAAEYLRRMEQSTCQRLTEYRETIRSCRHFITELGIKSKPKDDQKRLLLEYCRKGLSDEAVHVMDALFVVTASGDVKYGPVFGSGGNDGNLEFTYTFYKYIQSVLPVDEHSKDEEMINQSTSWLMKSLYDRGNPALLKDSVGQYFPGGLGGPNSTRGFDGGSRINPWDYVLAFEGALLLSGSASRRLGTGLSSDATYTFAVAASAAGWASLPENEADSRSRNRGEMWLPLWDKSACYKEIEYLFGEGRTQIGRRHVATGLDFARAVAGLGVDRGISSFQRIGFLAGDRNGRNYLAVSLGHFPVAAQQNIYLLDELDGWLRKYRVLISEGTPVRFRQHLRSIEESMFAYSRYGGAGRLQSIITELGAAVQAIAHNPAMTGQEGIPPLTISPRWLVACDDGSCEYRLAAAIASIASEDGIGSLRENIEPVEWNSRMREYMWQDNAFHVRESTLNSTLQRVLERRLIRAAQLNLNHAPLRSRLSSSIDDVMAYMNGNVDDTRVLSLIRGLALIDWNKAHREDLPSWKKHSSQMVNPAYALLKLLFMPNQLEWPRGASPVQVRCEADIIYHLQGGNIVRAAQTATRRLVSTGFRPLMSASEAQNIIVPKNMIQRLAGAMAIPVANWHELAAAVLSQMEV